jgi:glycosyltransferase involved in cell wall biosynthesis
LQTSGATHLHAHFGTNATEVAMLVHALGGPPYSFTVHGPEEFDKPEFLGLNEKIRRAAFVVAISSYGRSQLFRWAAYSSWPKIEVVHCGLEVGFAKGDEPDVPDVRRIVCVGRICEQKGQLLLVEAARVLARKGVSLEVVLVGDGELRAEVEASAQRSGLHAAVRVTGWLSGDAVRAQILSARALVLPSFAEGLPVAIMEAMALRRPVITTTVAGIPELVRAGQHGWLCAPGDVAALTDAIEECLATPIDTLRRMGVAARERVLERHDVDKAARKLAGLFAASSVSREHSA